jgi:fatty acid synthase subunit alpha
VANKVTAFLQRFGKPEEVAVLFSSGGYDLLASPESIRAPAENHTYAAASKDFNPIHTNPYFATLAKLPATITHGMWTR